MGALDIGYTGKLDIGPPGTLDIGTGGGAFKGAVSPVMNLLECHHWVSLGYDIKRKLYKKL